MAWRARERRVILTFHETATTWFAHDLEGPFSRPEVFMAIQDYVRSIAATETVSKSDVFRFLEMQFARADRDHDGKLDVDELALFVNAISRPDADQR
jgi:hypothetical protein